MTNEEFDTLFRSEYARLYRLAYSYLRRQEECRDIVSQVFADLYERPPRKMDDAGQVAAYLSRAVKSRCMDFIDHLQVEERVHQFYPLEQRLQSESDRQRDSILRDVWSYINSQLTEQTRKIVMMHYDDELTYEEVAIRLNISVSAVNKHITSALKKLRERFGVKYCSQSV